MASAVAAVAAATVAGCGGGGSSSSGSSGKGGTLRIGFSSPVDSLDPQSAISLAASEVFPSVFESLLGVDATGKVVPQTATSYRYEPRRKRISFDLDPRARFSDGKPLTSADVAFSVKVWQRGKTYGGYFDAIKTVSAPSPQRVVMRLKSPDAGLVGVLAASTASIYPKDYAGRSATAFWRKPIGSGPYALAAVKLNKEITLTRNRAYRVKGRPAYDDVDIRVIPDANQRLLQFQAGKLDIVNRIAGDDVAQFPGGSVKRTLGATLDLMVANLKDPTTKRKALRQAISLGLDRPALVKGGFGGSAELPTSVLQQIIPGVKPCPTCDYAKRDVARAKALVAQSGVGSKPIELVVSSTGGLELTAAQAMVPMLAQVGLKIKLAQVESSTLIDRLTKGDFQLLVTNYSALSPSPLDPLGFLASTQSLFSGADTAPLERALAGVRAASDEAAAGAATARFERAAYEDSALIPIAALKGAWAVSDRVRGFKAPAFQVYSAGDLAPAK